MKRSENRKPAETAESSSAGAHALCLGSVPRRVSAPRRDTRTLPKPDHSAAVEHLRRSDPVMEEIIARVGPCELGSRTDRGGPARDHYGALLRAIVGQQLSVSAARSIHGRL